MKRLALLLLVASGVLAQDVYVPPVPIGIARDGKVRNVKKSIPFPDAKEKWLRVRSPRFEIISSAPVEKTLDIAANLERLALALSRGAKDMQVDPSRATVFIFARRRESQPYFDLLIGKPNTTVTGAYVRHDGGGTMFIDAARRFERTAMHELLHDLLRQRNVLPPLWIEEGLAEFFSGAEVNKDAIVAGNPVAEHLALLARTKPRPLAEFFAVRAESDGATAPLFYAQSWAAVDWLMHLDQKKMQPFTCDVSNGMSVADALRTHYGKTLEELQRAAQEPPHARRAVRIPFEEDVAAISATELDRATLLFELGRFLSHVAGAEEESLRHYRAALDVDPRHARTLAALGEFERALAADPNNADVHLDYAEVLLQSAIGPFAGVFAPEEKDVEPFRKARKHAERALELGARADRRLSEEGRARGTIGTSHLVERDVRPAVAHLERARELAPNRMDFALNLFAIYLRLGERPKADALFASTFERARDKQTVFAARNLLLQFETDRANALTKAGKLDEAAEVVRSLAANTADPLAKRELEQQAAQLASLGTVNKHIAMYNEAIAAVNAGRKREAVRILDELLRVATDPQVVRDAQRLRAEAKK